MKVQVRLFAAARQRVGQETVDVLLPSGATLADLRRVLAQSQPELSDLLPRALFAIDAEYASDAALVSEQDRILLPENQRRCWERYAVPVQSIDGPHYPFHLWPSWEEVLACTR